MMGRPSPEDVIIRGRGEAGLTEEDALVQARVARILRANEYDFGTGEVKLWEPSRA